MSATHTSFYYECFRDDLDCEQEVRELVEFIWTKFSNSVQTKWLASIEVPITVEVAMSKISNIVDWAVLKHDGKVNPQIALEHQHPDMEPTPVCIDPWARGAVPTRKLIIPDTDIYRSVSGAIESEESKSFSGASVRSSRSSSTGYSSLRRSHSNRGLLTKGTTVASGLMESGNIFEIDDDESNGEDYAASAYLFEMLQKAAKQSKHGDVTEDVKDEFRIVQDEIDRVTKDIKGKKYTLDIDGKPVVINPIEPDSLPPFAFQLSLNISSGKPNNSGDNAPSKSKESLSSLNKKKKYRVRIAGSRDIIEDDAEDAFFTASSTLATSLTGTNIVLNPGVSLKTNDHTREGPPPAEDPKKPSRKAFFKNQATANALGALGFGDSRVLPSRSSGPATFDTLNQSLGAASDAFTSATTHSPASGGGTVAGVGGVVGGGGGGTSGGSGFGYQPKFNEIDPFEGSRKLLPKNQALQHEPDDAELGLGPVVTVGKSHPPKLPSKPSTKQGEIVDQLFGGRENPNPRDRDPPRAQVAVAERKRLPPPPIGQATRPRANQSGVSSGASILSGMSSLHNPLNDNLATNSKNQRILKTNSRLSDDNSSKHSIAFSSSAPVKALGGKIKKESNEVFQKLF